MTNNNEYIVQERLKQIERAIEWCNTEESGVVYAMGRDEFNLAMEALALLREVEEGKAHVMRWVKLEEYDTVKQDYGEMLGYVGDDTYRVNYKLEQDHGTTHYATFNNNGEIPMPKGE